MTSPTDSASPDAMEIAPDYTVRHWKALDLNSGDATQWATAIRIFETRIRRRFIEPVDVLIAHEIGQDRGTFGFAILAIDCLLVETLQGFRDGVVNHAGHSKAVVRKFLSSKWKRFFDDGDTDGSKSDSFYKRCRCGIHHSGQTSGDFRVWRSGAMITFDDDRVTVNRTAFHEALKHEFDAYLAELADTSQTGLRANFKKKMDAICGIPDEAKPEEHFGSEALA
jgi:hypothetical protein